MNRRRHIRDGRSRSGEATADYYEPGMYAYNAAFGSRLGAQTSTDAATSYAASKRLAKIRAAAMRRSKP